MKKYKVYGKVVGWKYIGEAEAETEDEAKEKAWNHENCFVDLCHHCAGEADDAEITEIELEESDT